MEYRRLGNSGLQVSALSLGSWVTFGSQITDDVAEKLMHTAYEAGVNFFDNAEVYASGKSEIVMGNILKSANWDRSTYIVSSKVFWGGQLPNQKGLMRKHIFEACESALKRLQVDYLDLFFCHRPDVNTPISETVWAMNTLIQQGKITYWGTSEWTGQQITEAHYWAERYKLIGPIMEQPQYNMFERKKVELDYLPVYKTFGLGTTIWSPLASGLLSGKHIESSPADSRFEMPSMSWLKERVLSEQDKIEKVKLLKSLADALAIPLPHLAIGWCLKNPNVSTVILGASKVEQLLQNLACWDSMPKITEDVMLKVEDILENKPVLITF